MENHENIGKLSLLSYMSINFTYLILQSTESRMLLGVMITCKSRVSERKYHSHGNFFVVAQPRSVA